MRKINKKWTISEIIVRTGGIFLYFLIGAMLLGLVMRDKYEWAKEFYTNITELQTTFIILLLTYMLIYFAHNMVTYKEEDEYTKITKRTKI